jgi:hypothetical protein
MTIKYGKVQGQPYSNVHHILGAGSPGYGVWHPGRLGGRSGTKVSTMKALILGGWSRDMAVGAYTEHPKVTGGLLQ